MGTAGDIWGQLSSAMSVLFPPLPRTDFQDFSRVMQENRFWVEAAARRQLGDPALAEEVAQDVFLQLAALPGRPEDIGALRSWLLRCVWYLSANARRKAMRRRSAEAGAIRENLDAGHPHPPPALPVEELKVALDSLPELERTLILEYYFEGRSHAEAGARHHLSAEAARKRITRALNRMRTHLEHHGSPLPWLSLAAGLGLGNPGTATAAATTSTVSGSLKASVLTVLACTTVAFPVWWSQQQKITGLQQQTVQAIPGEPEALIFSGPPVEEPLWTPFHRETDPALFPDVLPLTQGFSASFSAWSQAGDFSGPLSLRITLTLTNLPAGLAVPADPADSPALNMMDHPPPAFAAGNPP